MKRFEIIPRQSWKNIKTGATASIYGSLPYKNAGDAINWIIVTRGYTFRDKKHNTVGSYHICANMSVEEVSNVIAAYAGPDWMNQEL